MPCYRDVFVFGYLQNMTLFFHCFLDDIWTISLWFFIFQYNQTVVVFRLDMDAILILDSSVDLAFEAMRTIFYLVWFFCSGLWSIVKALRILNVVSSFWSSDKLQRVSSILAIFITELHELVGSVTVGTIASLSYLLWISFSTTTNWARREICFLDIVQQRISTLGDWVHFRVPLNLYLLFG